MMRSTRTRLVLSLAATAFLAGAVRAAAPGRARAGRAYPPAIEADAVEVYKTVADVELRIWVFHPKGHAAQDKRPAIVFFFGTDDFLLDGARWMQKRMEQEGNRCELLTWEGLPHGFFNKGRYDDKPFVETVRAADEFLASLGWLEGEPTIE